MANPTQKYPSQYNLLSTASDADIVIINKSVPVDPVAAPLGYTTYYTTMANLKTYFTQTKNALYTASEYKVTPPVGWAAGNPLSVTVLSDTQFATTRFAVLVFDQHAPYTINLPNTASTLAGDRIVILPTHCDFSLYNAVMNHNDIAINGISDNVTLNIKGLCMDMTCFDPAIGWQITNTWTNTIT